MRGREREWEGRGPVTRCAWCTAAASRLAARTLTPRPHLQVRDALTTTHEQALLRAGGRTSPTLSRDAVLVDAIVNTGGWQEAQGRSCRVQPPCMPHLPPSPHALRAHALAAPAHPPAVGFPLVGGPAGTMEGGRQSEIAKAILGTKNVPYVVAAPLLIQVQAGRASEGWQGMGRRRVWGRRMPTSFAACPPPPAVPPRRWPCRTWPAGYVTASAACSR